MPRYRIALYHNLHSGGAKRVVSEHLHHLSRRHDLTLFSLTSADHAFASYAADGDIPAVLAEHRPVRQARSPFGRINPLLRLLGVARMDALARQIAGAIDQRGFDVVLVHPCQVTQTPLLLRWLTTPTLYYCHELPRRLYEPRPPRPYDAGGPLRDALNQIDPLIRLERRVMRILDRLAARRATGIATNSEYTRANIRQAYRRESVVCRLGVNVPPLPSPVGRTRTVLSVGSLTPDKGFDFVIEALGSIPAAARPPLTIISNFRDEREHGYLRDRARRSGVSLEMLTNVGEDELRERYVRAGCVAYAPVREPLGLVALEAMAAGTPVVGVAEGGVRETVIHDQTGVLTPRDPALFGRAVADLLDDPARAGQFGSAGRRVVQERWSWDQHIHHLELLLDQAIGLPAASLQAL